MEKLAVHSSGRFTVAPSAGVKQTAKEKEPAPDLVGWIAGGALLCAYLAGFAMAIEWVKRCPNPMPGDSEIEIRPVMGIEEFGDAATPELRRQEECLCAGFP